MAPVATHYDTVIVGGGASGVCAALAAARNGLKTLLVEQYGFLGGQAATSLFLPMKGYFSGRRKIIDGIADEIIQRISALGSPGHVDLGDTYYTYCDPEHIKVAYEQFILEEKIDLLFHAQCTGAVYDNNRITSVILHCKEGNRRISANSFIDATGIGTLARTAKIPLHEEVMPAAYRFSVTQVKTSDLIQEIEDQAKKERLLISEGKIHFSFCGFQSFTAEWNANHSELAPINAIELESHIIEGNIIISMIFCDNISPSRFSDQSRMAYLQQVIPYDALACLKRTSSSFRDARILVTPPQFGYRGTGTFKTKYTVPLHEAMDGTKYSDSIGEFSLPGPDARSFHMPQRSLFVNEYSNLLLTGRMILPSISLYSTNNQPASMKLGEVAGTLVTQM